MSDENCIEQKSSEPNFSKVHGVMFEALLYTITSSIRKSKIPKVVYNLSKKREK